jgi:hypothetical protein
MIYVHGLFERSDLDVLLKAVKSRIFVVAAVSGMDADRLFPKGNCLDDPELCCGWWNMEPLPESGKVRLDMDYGKRGR